MAFRVPESARVLDGPLGTKPNEGLYGAFVLPSPESGWVLWLIVSGEDDPAVPEADGWEHVSVRATRGQQERTPTWKEMVFAKGLCWEDEDVVFQLHPRASEYVNVHPHVLHLWRHRTQACPEPPKHLVG